ncbi:MAG TPA: MFS transporter [Jatrophihabitans sp.]|jgi:EmrB/QacA subfamily drug resistance transporter|nr:MFS transporter [Jatrophihabitans sp.]
MTTRMQRWVLALTATAALMVALDQLVVATALNAIRDDLHASITTLDWTVNSYSLTFAVLLITGAALGDRYGRRRMFVIGITLFCVASAACALAPNTATLIAARAAQGVGSALVMPLSVALLTAAYPPEKRGPIVGIYTALTGLAVVGGPVVGGAVTEGIAWQWIFWINVPIGAVVIPLALRHIAESRGERTRPDLAGLVLASTAMLGVVWGLIRADAVGWSSAEVLSTLTGGAILAIAFVAWELRVREPMLPMKLFRVRAYSAGNGATLLLTTSLFGTVFLFAQYLQISLGYSPLAAGLRFMPWTTTLFVFAPLAGALSDRIGSRPLLVSGLALQGVGMGWLAHNVAQASPYTSSIAALVIAGCGTSLALPSGQNAVMNSVPAAYVGKAAGVFNSVRQLGGVLGIAIVSAVFAARGGYAGPDTFRDGVAPALYVAAAIAIAGALVGAFVARARRVVVVEPQPEAVLDAVG